MTDIVEIIAALLPNIDPVDAVLFFMLILTRWIVMTVTMPILGGHLLPSAVRLGLAATLSAVCFVLLVDQQDFPHLSIIVVGLLFVKEALLGFLFGFLASLIFYTYELAGELIDFARAANMSRLLVPELKHQSSALGVLLFQLSLVIFIALGFHRQIIEVAIMNFVTFPVFSTNAQFMHAHNFSILVNVFGALFESAVQFALPIVVVSFLIDLAFGLMNRVAPQINAYFLSLPAKMLGGLVIVLIVIPFLVDDFSEHAHKLTTFFREFSP